MTLDDAIADLVAAQAEIDSWDHDFTPAPYHLYDEAAAALAQVPEGERANVVELLRSPRVDVRREAAHACAIWKLGGVHDALVAGLADEHADVRDACGDALVATAAETALGLFADRRAQLSKRVLQAAAIAAFEALGLAVMPWLERVDLTPDTTIGERDVWSRLAALDRDAVGAVLERHVASGRYDWVYGASYLLRHFGGGAWVRPAFLPLLQHRDTSISTIAAEVLQKFGDAESLEALLATARAATHPWQRHSAVQGALNVGLSAKVAVVERAAPLLANDERSQLMLMEALARLVDAAWEPRLALERLVRQGLHHVEPKVVAAAIQAALALQLDALLPDVTATLSHRRWYDNELSSARGAYLAWRPEATLGALAAAVERGLASGSSGDLELATRATWVLMKAPGGRAHAELVRRALASTHAELRSAAAATLAEFGVGSETESLLERARLGAPEESSVMLKALARLRVPAAVDVALNRIADVLAGAPIPNDAPSAWLCAAAIDVFEAWPTDARAFDALCRSLRHREMRMRRDAAQALGRVGDRRAVALLEPLVDDREKQVREAAQTALGALNAPR
ncbi:MAG: HEAT repeat domain-containing protein [Myxococcaceae bacterium]